VTRPDHDPSIHAEPHFTGQDCTSDPTEEKAARLLESERKSADPDEERAKHSIFDEPATLPNRPSILIDRDWNCRNCGYNLRGLMTGHRCPECGQIELYEPPREGEQTYAQWVAVHGHGPSAAKSWVVVSLVPVASLPFAIVCAMLTVGWAVLNFVVFGPAMAEVLKVAITLTIIERRSLLIRSSGQIYVATLGTAAVFACVQNAVYLMLYFKNSPPELVAYRWTAAVVLHALCTAIAARGLVSVWQRARTEHRQPRLALAYPAIIAAIIVHAAFNACVFVRGYYSYGF
jgi:hypothetical protein